MIRQGGKWLRWDRIDDQVMQRILGADGSSNEYTAILDSVIYAASRRGVDLALPLARDLERAIAERREIKRIIRQEDVIHLRSKYEVVQLNRLFQHQRVALALADRTNAYLLADQPGVGKTPVAIMWANARAVQRILVVTTSHARDQWAREIHRWGRENAHVSIVQGKIVEQDKIARRDGWVVTHWESLVHARNAILARPWDVVILDEAHHIRNRKAKRSDTAFVLGKTTQNKIALTGHPYFTTLDELFSILKFLHPDRYSSFWRFFSMHVEAVPRYFGGLDIIGPRRPKLLNWEMRPFTIRRKKSEVFASMPKITRTSRTVEMNDKIRAEYKRLVKELFVDFPNRSLTIVNALARTTRIRQYLVDPVLVGSTAARLKFDSVRETMDSLDGPPVIFTSFREAARNLHNYLGNPKRIARIEGGMSTKKQALVKQRFHDGDLEALIVVTAAGSQALNLGRYGYVIFLDLPWTPADLEQAEARVDRPIEGTGETVPTTAYRIIVKDTYEERIVESLETRKRGFDSVFSRHDIEKLFA